MNLKDYVRLIPDFPNRGILFRDITTVLKEPEAFKAAVDAMSELLSGCDFDLILGPESRGFIFGAPISYNLDKGFILVRKAGKLPYETVKKEYSLEYGTAEIEIHRDAILKGQHVVIIDDLLATGGTAGAIAELVEDMGGIVEMFIFFLEIDELNGRDKLSGYEVRSVLRC